MHADAVRRPNREQRIDCLQQEARAVLDRAAITIGPQVRSVVQKLIEQVTICRVKLDTIKTSALCVCGADPEILDDAGNFFGLQRARYGVRALRPHPGDMAFWRNGTGGDRKLAVMVDRVGNSADVPQAGRRSGHPHRVPPKSPLSSRQSASRSRCPACWDSQRPEA